MAADLFLALPVSTLAALLATTDLLADEVPEIGVSCPKVQFVCSLIVLEFAPPRGVLMETYSVALCGAMAFGKD